MDILLIFLGVLVVCAVVVAILRRPGKSTPDEPLRNDPDARAGSDVSPPYPGQDRPAGPGAEPMSTKDPGEPTPDPGGEDGSSRPG